MKYSTAVRYNTMESHLSGLKDALYDDESAKDIEVSNSEQETNAFVDRYELETIAVRLFVSNSLKSRDK